MRFKSELLKYMRLRDGVTQEEVARACNIDVKTYRRYERGYVNEGRLRYDDMNRAAQFDVIAQLASYFHLSRPEELIAAASSPPAMARYVNREIEEKKILNRLRLPGKPVAIQGPWHSGKSTLLTYIENHLRVEGGDGISFIRVSVAGLDVGKSSSFSDFLYKIALAILSALDAERAPQLVAKAWQEADSPASKLTWLLHEHVLPAKGTTYLALEETDITLEHSFHDSFFALLRGWAEKNTLEPWSRLRLLTSVATEPVLLEKTDHSAFFAMASPIRLKAFDIQQTRKLIETFGAQISQDEFARLHELVNGNPYLLQHVLTEAALCECSVSALLAQMDFRGGVFEHHLGQLRRWLLETSLIKTVERLIEQPGCEIDFLHYCRLYSKGLLVEESPGCYRMSCKLYSDYFSSYSRLP